MKEFPFKKMDAFVVGASSGNPAGCIYLENDRLIAAEEMQQIARELKGYVNEVGFLSPDAEGYQLRYYSSECEVDFCGHATIAIMYDLIAHKPELRIKKQLSIGVKAGRLLVFNRVDEEDAVYIMAPLPRQLSCNLSPSDVAHALKTDVAGIDHTHPIQAINGGLRTLIVPLTSLEVCLQLRPDQEELRLFCASRDLDIILVFTEETSLATSNFRTRVFAPKFGYLEDPATGSGNAAFGYYLIQLEKWVDQPIIEQGPSKGNPNIVKLRRYRQRDTTRVLFGGSSVVRVEGNYILHG